MLVIPSSSPWTLMILPHGHRFCLTRQLEVVVPSQFATETLCICAMLGCFMLESDGCAALSRPWSTQRTGSWREQKLALLAATFHDSNLWTQLRSHELVAMIWSLERWTIAKQLNYGLRYRNAVTVNSDYRKTSGLDTTTRRIRYPLILLNRQCNNRLLPHTLATARFLQPFVPALSSQHCRCQEGAENLI
jgi:hypothetical protein